MTDPIAQLKTRYLAQGISLDQRISSLSGDPDQIDEDDWPGLLDELTNLAYINLAMYMDHTSIKVVARIRDKANVIHPDLRGLIERYLDQKSRMPDGCDYSQMLEKLWLQGDIDLHGMYGPGELYTIPDPSDVVAHPFGSEITDSE